MLRAVPKATRCQQAAQQDGAGPGPARRLPHPALQEPIPSLRPWEWTVGMGGPYAAGTCPKQTHQRVCVVGLASVGLGSSCHSSPGRGLGQPGQRAVHGRLRARALCTPAAEAGT